MEISSTPREEYLVSMRKLECGCVKRCVSNVNRGKKGIGYWMCCWCNMMEVKCRRWA